MRHATAAVLVCRRGTGDRGADACQCIPCHLDHDLEVIPVINKIDLPSADPDRVVEEIEDVIGLEAQDAPRISAKTGLNVEEVLEQIGDEASRSVRRRVRAAAGIDLRFLCMTLSKELLYSVVSERGISRRECRFA